VALASIAHTLGIGIQRKRIEQALLAKTLQLEKSNSELEQFAFVAAHDLQEPMRMVNVYTELLGHELSDDLGGNARMFMEEISSGAKRMNHLLQDLLAYAETARNPTTSSHKIDLTVLLKEVILNLHGSIENESARVTIGPLPSLHGHARHFAQLFQNLIGNAIKYRSAAAPVVNVTASQCGGEWVFRVQDNGLGIDPQHHNLVFGMFRRLHGRSIPGTGIGLAICQKTVDRYGGRIWVESEGEGCGCTFCFTYPV
jgi:light-regulated signal transduction histidine kinase (bacteriophytochrome)